VLDLGKSLEAGKLTDLAVVDLINTPDGASRKASWTMLWPGLYRACEMLAQWRLASSYGIVSGT